MPRLTGDIDSDTDNRPNVEVPRLERNIRRMTANTADAGDLRKRSIGWSMG